MPPDFIRTPTDPHGHYAEGHQVLALTDQLNDAATHQEAAQITERVLDPGDGVLVRLGQFFEAAAERARASATDAGEELSHRFDDAVVALADLEEDLHTAASQLRALGEPQRPSWQASVARYYATATKRPATAPATEADRISRDHSAPAPSTRRTR